MFGLRGLLLLLLWLVGFPGVWLRRGFVVLVVGGILWVCCTRVLDFGCCGFAVVWGVRDCVVWRLL